VALKSSSGWTSSSAGGSSFCTSRMETPGSGEISRSSVAVKLGTASSPDSSSPYSLRILRACRRLSPLSRRRERLYRSQR